MSVTNCPWPGKKNENILQREERAQLRVNCCNVGFPEAIKSGTYIEVLETTTPQSMLVKTPMVWTTNSTAFACSSPGRSLTSLCSYRRSRYFSMHSVLTRTEPTQRKKNRDFLLRVASTWYTPKLATSKQAIKST